jgi:hypothetical protein
MAAGECRIWTLSKSPPNSGRAAKQCGRAVIPWAGTVHNTRRNAAAWRRHRSRCCNEQEGETTMATYQGRCFCGAVEIEVNGAPEAMGYCHCNSCRSWSAAPVNAFTLWKPENVKVTKGADLVGHFMKTTMSDRQYCTKCGGHLMNNHPPLGLVDVYAATIPSVKFVPVVHVNYAETVLPMRDGLPKLKDFPAEMGGSGIVLPE